MTAALADRRLQVARDHMAAGIVQGAGLHAVSRAEVRGGASGLMVNA